MFFRIRELRLENKMTQDEVARAIGVSKSTYARYEKGKSKIKLTKFIKIALLHGVNIDYLCGLTNKK